MVTELLSLVHDILVVFGIVYIFGLFLPSFKWHPPLVKRVMLGVAFGLFGIVNMMFAFVLQPGIINDIRNPIIIVATVCGGWLTGLITAGAMGAYRFFVVGGLGAVGGTGTIFSNVLLGVLFLRLHPAPPRGFHWLVLGFISVWISAGWSTATLPPEINRLFLQNFIPTAILLYPFTTLLLGRLIKREQEHLSLIEQLRLSERRFRAIFDGSFQFSGLLNPDGRVLEVNQTALAFINAENSDVIGKYFWDTPWWKLSEATQQQLREGIEAATKGEFVRYRVDVAGANNVTTTLDFSIKPIFDSAGRIAMLIPEGRDIANEIAAEERRIQLGIERERLQITTQFIEDSSHHFKTPLSILGTSVYLLGKMMNKVETTADSIADCLLKQQFNQTAHDIDTLRQSICAMQKRLPVFEDSLTELNKLVDDLLEFVRLEKPDGITLDKTDLKQLVADEIHSFEPIAQSRTLTLQADLPSEPIHTLADADATQVIIQNLVMNALNYTPAEGNITVRLTEGDTHNVLTVQDTGIGIPEADHERIFERFYRAENARLWHSRGSGLGLAIVKRMVEAQNGTISVASELNAGTTFTVRLPRLVHANSTTEPPP